MLPAHHPEMPGRHQTGSRRAAVLAGDIIAILREAHHAVQDARARGSTALDPKLLEELRRRYDQAAAFGVTHNRHRGWDTGNHPGYALGRWLQQYKEQVFLFTRDFAVDWTNNVSERCAKAARRHQAVSGYWHSFATLTRWYVSEATWTPPPPTASPHSTPSALPSKATPGYRHCPPSSDASSRHP